MSCDDCGGLGPCRHMSESPPRAKWCDVCGQLEASCFTEVYDPMMEECRTYWLCYRCQSQLSEKIRSIVDRGMVA